KQQMMRVLRNGFIDILKIQGLVTLAIVFEAERIFRFLYLSPHGYNLVRMCSLGAFFQCVFLLINVITFYYEAYREAFIGAFTVLVGNVLISVLTVPDATLHGLGLVLGGALGAGVGLWLLLPMLRDLEFYTFSRQPMPGQLSLDPRLLAGADSFGQYIIQDGELRVKVQQPGGN
ncbi:MAG: exopolysaccharide Pel transporter PelG, partial [Candidatus Xenobia bacterium]